MTKIILFHLYEKILFKLNYRYIPKLEEAICSCLALHTRNAHFSLYCSEYSDKIKTAKEMKAVIITTK